MPPADLSPQRNSALLIVLTGMDGAGKTEQALRLVQTWRDQGVDACYLWCRGRNLLSLPFILLGRRLHGAPRTHLDLITDADRQRESSYQGRKTRLLRNPVIRAAWSVAVLAERLLQLGARVGAACRKHQVVVADRFLYDSFIDLADDLGEPCPTATRRLQRWYLSLLPRPDCVLCLDLEPAVAFARKSDIPSLDYLLRRRKLYQAFAAAGGWTTLDAGQSKERVFASLQHALDQARPLPVPPR